MIVAHPSPLKLRQRYIEGFSLKAASGSTKNSNKQPKISLDFDVFSPKSNTNEFLQQMELEVNTSRTRVTGYVIKLKVMYLFELPTESLTKQEITNFRTYTALSIGIADLRNFLSISTAPFQFGAYSLPYINITKLIEDKVKTEAPVQTEKLTAQDKDA